MTCCNLIKQINKLLSSKKILFISLFSFLLLLLLLPLAFHLLPLSVYATGGAFVYTKHGGGTTDGSFPYPYPIDDGYGYGVNRAVNPDYLGGYYNNLSEEAGRYKRGECNHCHEPHGSFGGSEPPPNLFTGNPNDEGPDPYLLMKDYGGDSPKLRNYANLCWYCHENYLDINNSGSPLGMGKWSFYQGKSVYEISTHYTNPSWPTYSMYWPGTGGGGEPWPRKDRSNLPSGNRGSCLNCHTPHGIKGSDLAQYDTFSPDGSGGVPVNRQFACISSNNPPDCNPSVSKDFLIPRQLISWEETLCERCHDASGPAPNIQTEINKRVTGSGHPVDDTNLAGRHVVSESLPITVKHVECYDCHNPHAVKAPTTALGDGNGGRVAGMKYIDVNGTVWDPAKGIPDSNNKTQPYIYEICFKCHGNSYNQVFTNDYPFPDVAKNRSSGGGTWIANDKHFSNKRKEFNPNSHQYMNYPSGDIGYNTSYHPVASPGRNGTFNLCMQLKAAFSLDCGDINGVGSDNSVASNSLSNLTIQCTDCHNSEATGTVNGPVTESNLRATDKNSVYLGTSSVGPHGSERNKLLRGNYVTTNTDSGSGGGARWYFIDNNRLDTNGRPKFEVCFLCHAEDRLIGSYNKDTNTVTAGQYTNFGSADGDFVDWDANLHLLHLSGAKAVCHDCHHNVHSNVEAQNTIYGNGFGGQLPPDNHDNITDGRVDTHLINFGPQESGHTALKPRWYWDGNSFRCNLYCHNYSMSACSYRHGASSGQWCAPNG